MGLLKLGADAWHIATHDLRVALRQRETQLWTFLMPILFFWFIGTVTGGFAPSGPAGDLDPVPLDVHVEPGAGFVVEGLVARLEQSGFAVNRIDAAAHSEADPERLALFVPADLSQRLLAGEDQVLRFQGKSGGLFGEFGEFALQQAVLGTLGDLTALAALERPPSAEALAELREAPSSVTLDVRPARRDQRAVIPSGFDQAVPGTMVMFTLLLLLTSGASTWIIERREGVLLRLGAAPIQRTAVVLGKALGKGGLGAVQLTYAMVLGHLAFGVDWGPTVQLRGVPVGPVPVARQPGQERRAGDRTRRPVRQRLRRPRRLLVADRGHARVDADPVPVPAHGLGHGRTAQAGQLRRTARRGAAPRGGHAPGGDRHARAPGAAPAPQLRLTRAASRTRFRARRRAGATRL
jgi:hypothetical protein